MIEALKDTAAAVAIVSTVGTKVSAIKITLSSVSDALATECEQEELLTLVDKAKCELACTDLKTHVDMGKALHRTLFAKPRPKASAR